MKLVICKECGREHILVSGEKYEKCERCGAAAPSKKNLLPKILIALAATLIIVATVLLIYLFKVKYITQDGVRYEKTGDFYTVSGYDSELSGSLRIPSSINDVPVGAIGYEAFSGSNLTAVVIPESVKVIGEKAFASSDMLEVITFSQGLEEIGDHAFFHCDGLLKADLPDGIKKIGSSAFYYCKSLVSMRIPSSVTELGMSVFARCYGLESIAIENGIKKIPYSTFEECTKLVNVKLPASVTQIEEKAFYRTARLEKIDILGRIIEKEGKDDTRLGIGKSAFEGCLNLEVINYAYSQSAWQGIAKGKFFDKDTGDYKVNCDYSE